MISSALLSSIQSQIDGAAVSAGVKALAADLAGCADGSGAVALPLDVALALAGVTGAGALRRKLAPLSAAGLAFSSILRLDPPADDCDPDDPFADSGEWLFVWFRAGLAAGARARFMAWYAPISGSADERENAQDPGGREEGGRENAPALVDERENAPILAQSSADERENAQAGAGDRRENALEMAVNGALSHTGARAHLFVSDLNTDQVIDPLLSDPTNKQNADLGAVVSIAIAPAQASVKVPAPSAWERRRAASAKVAALAGAPAAADEDPGAFAALPALSKAIRLLTAPAVGLPVAQARRLAAEYFAGGLEYGDLFGSVLQWDRQRDKLTNPGGALVSRIRCGWRGDYVPGDENGELWRYADLSWPAAVSLIPALKYDLRRLGGRSEFLF